VNEIQGPRAGRPAAYEAAARYDGANLAAIREVAGGRLDESGPAPEVRTGDGRPGPLYPGDWVVRYPDGEAGVLSPAAYRRFFGE
jgi:hypothetical protein